MPFTMNGVGTSVCDGRGFVKWGGPSDYDAVECFVIVWLPIIPYKAVHTFNWNGNQYQQIPIRWSADLLLRALLRRWLAAPFVAALFCLIIGWTTLQNEHNKQPEYTLLVVGCALLAVCFGGWWLLRITDQRTRDIRRVLGPHDLGSSDPATWTERLLRDVNEPGEMYGTACYAEAVEPLLEKGEYARAMWAARLTLACEDRARGEELTNLVLGHPGVREAVAQVRRDPRKWAQVMHPAT